MIAANGVYPTSDSARGTAALLARLEDQQTAENLHRLLDKLDVLAFAVEAADGLLRRGETIADAVGESLSDARRLASATLGPVTSAASDLAPQLPQIARAGVDVAQLMATPEFQNLTHSGLLERLGKRETIESIHSLLNHLELLAMSATMLDGFIRRGDQLVENMSGMIAELRKDGASISQDDIDSMKEAAQGLISVARTMHSSHIFEEMPRLLTTLVELIRSGVFDPSTVRVLAEVGSAASASYQKTVNEKPSGLGPWGLFQALGDEDVQKSMGFLIAMARNYGKTLK